MKKFKLTLTEDIMSIEREINSYLLDLRIELFHLDDIGEIEDTMKEALKDFESFMAKNKTSKEVEIRTYFYNKLYYQTMNFRSLYLTSSIADDIVDNIEELLNRKKKNPYFMCLMDTYILTALFYVRVNDPDTAQVYFTKAVNCGEKYLEDSKKTFHDALNCAYTWVGSYEYNNKMYEDSLFHFKRVLELYDSVKDDPNYCVKEADSVPNSIAYIQEIEKKLKK